jgi:hypothetical protein
MEKEKEKKSRSTYSIKIYLPLPPPRVGRVNIGQFHFWENMKRLLYSKTKQN